MRRQHMSITTSFGLVYPNECDHMGHLNIAYYVQKFDSATWNFFFNLGVTPSMLRDTPLGIAAVENVLNYKKELMAGDVIEVRTRLIEVSERKMRFRHEMIHRESGVVAATSEFVGVCFDREQHKAQSFPSEILAKARDLLKDESM
jgi:acyl-CoA thioester hydrolase